MSFSPLNGRSCPSLQGYFQLSTRRRFFGVAQLALAPQKQNAPLSGMRIVNNIFNSDAEATPRLWVDTSKGSLDAGRISNVTIADNNHARGTRATARVSWQGSLPAVCVGAGRRWGPYALRMRTSFHTAALLCLSPPASFLLLQKHEPSSSDVLLLTHPSPGYPPALFCRARPSGHGR